MNAEIIDSPMELDPPQPMNVREIRSVLRNQKFNASKSFNFDYECYSLMTPPQPPPTDDCNKKRRLE